MSIDGQVISSCEMICEGNNFFKSISILIIMFSNKETNNTIASLGKIINENVNVICYYSKVFVPSYLRYISQNIFSTLSPLYVPIKEHDNIVDKSNLREINEFDISVLIGTQ